MAERERDHTSAQPPLVPKPAPEPADYSDEVSPEYLAALEAEIEAKSKAVPGKKGTWVQLEEPLW